METPQRIRPFLTAASITRARHRTRAATYDPCCHRPPGSYRLCWRCTTCTAATCCTATSSRRTSSSRRVSAAELPRVWRRRRFMAEGGGERRAESGGLCYGAGVWRAVLRDAVAGAACEAKCVEYGNWAQGPQDRFRRLGAHPNTDWFGLVWVVCATQPNTPVAHRGFRRVKSPSHTLAPGNLLKLGDFGIARVLNSDTELARTVVRADGRGRGWGWGDGCGLGTH